jgi:hypothetical protein
MTVIIGLSLADRYPRLFKAGKLALIVLSSFILALAWFVSKLIIDGSLTQNLALLNLLGAILLLVSVLIGGYRNYCILLGKTYGHFIIPAVWRSETFRLASWYMVAYFSVVGSYAISLGMEQFFPLLIAHFMFYPILVLRWMVSVGIGVTFKKKDDLS